MIRKITSDKMGSAASPTSLLEGFNELCLYGRGESDHNLALNTMTVTRNDNIIVCKSDARNNFSALSLADAISAGITYLEICRQFRKPARTY